MKPIFFSTFTGFDGAGWGAEAAGYEVVGGVEFRADIAAVAATNHPAAIAAQGWSVETTTDRRGLPYYRATRGGYTRGAYRPASLREDCEAAPMTITPYYDHGGITIYHGDCREVLPTLPAASADLVFADPPYPEIDRPYGRLTEAEWFDLMRAVVQETRRILKPTGSAVFILQPNSEHVGQMRGWLWRFMAWCADEWNIVQDAYWWNTASPPTVHAHRGNGLMRGSVKTCIWLGEPNCYRNQDAVLWRETDANIAARAAGRFELRRHTSGLHIRAGRAASVAAERGGVTPFNLLPIANTDSQGSAGAHGHGAGTPAHLVNWWLRYLSRAGDTVVDMFLGSGTTGIEAANMGRRFVGVEKDPLYVETARRRVSAASTAPRQMGIEEAA